LDLPGNEEVASELLDSVGMSAGYGEVELQAIRHKIIKRKEMHL
jgi:hypothetical protein